MKTYQLKINDNAYTVAINSLSGGMADVTVNGKSYTVAVENGAQAAPKAVASSVVVEAPAPVAPKAAVAAGGGAIKSPLPGVILDIKVAVGDSVQVGQRLMVLEAMKMENNVDSDKAGKVKEIKVATGQSVLEGDVLVVIE